MAHGTLLDAHLLALLDAHGSGKLTYAWYVKDPGKDSFSKSSVTKATYETTMTAAKDGRQVYCVVKDSAGKKVTSNTVTLTTVPKLMITTQPQYGRPAKEVENSHDKPLNKDAV